MRNSNILLADRRKFKKQNKLFKKFFKSVGVLGGLLVL